MSEQSLSKQELWLHRINDYRASGLTAQEWWGKTAIQCLPFAIGYLRLKGSIFKKKFLSRCLQDFQFIQQPH